MYKLTKERIGRTVYDCVHVTELPIGVWTKKYLTWLEKQREDYIHDIREKCGTEIDIKIILKEGAKKQIEDKYGKEDLTPMEHCFNLSTSMRTWLNLTDADGIVHEFKSYEEIFDKWFEARKNLYTLRLKRMLIVTKLRIKFLENVIRFCDIYKSLKLPNKPENEVMEILNENNFTKFTKSPIDEPKYVDIDMLKETYLGEGANYEYLVRLSTRDMYAQSIKAKKDKLAELKELLDDIKDDDDMWLGAKWWLRDLDQLISVIEEGRKTEWMFGHTNFNWGN